MRGWGIGGRGGQGCRGYQGGLAIVEVRGLFEPLDHLDDLDDLDTLDIPVALTNEQFDALVARLTREAESRPLWYKTRVFLLAMLGYAYVFGILLVLLAIVAGVLYIVSTGRGLRLLSDLAIPLAVFAWFVSKSLWVKIEPPEGREVHSDEAPRLFAAIDDVCRKLRAPRADVVLLNEDYNAMVSQVPRLGIFG